MKNAQNSKHSINGSLPYHQLFLFLFLLSFFIFKAHAQDIIKGNEKILEKSSEESLSKNGFPDGFFWGLDYGNGFIKNGGNSFRLSMDWMPSRWGLHLAASKTEAPWGSIKTSTSPGSMEDPTLSMPSNAQVLLPRTDKSLFDFTVAEVGIGFTSRYLRKSVDWLMQSQMGILLGDVSDTEKSTTFAAKGFFAETGLLMNIGSDKKNWIRGSISITGLRALSQRSEALTEEERSLYFQFYQLHLGYFYRFF